MSKKGKAEQSSSGLFFQNGKKGFELQFHWIFILIAGGLILAFFFSVATKQKSISQEKLELTLATDIENILAGAIASRGTAQELPVPPQGMAFECTEGCECRFRIERAAKNFGDKPIFAPAFLKDKDLTVWALEMKMPYRVTNFLYITNPNIKYYFVYNEESKQFLEQITKGIPPLIQYEKITQQQMTSVKEEGYQHTKFILLNTEPTTLHDSFKKTGTSAIKIDDKGITFYEKDGTKFKKVKYLSYAGMPTLYAAIFAEDYTMYECGLKTAFRKLGYLGQLYGERTKELEIQANNPLCTYGTSECKGNSEEICRTTPLPGATVIELLCQQHHCGKALANKLDQAYLANLNTIKELLDSANRNYLQQSCPELF